MSHGLSYHPTYRVWLGIRARCTNPNHPAYPNYGGRGITLSDEWADPAAFIDALGTRPTPKHEIDRIDNARGYEPGNVRWTTRTVNSRNRRSSVWVEYRGQRRLFIEVCEEHDIRQDTVKWRLKRGYTLEDALTEPVRAKAPNGSASGERRWRCARLTDDQRRAIHARYAAGNTTYAALAAEFGCKPSIVGIIVKTPRWAAP